MIDRAAIIAKIKAAITASAEVNPKEPGTEPGTEPDPPASLPPSVERAKAMVTRLRQLGFRPYLDDHGVLLIADATGRGRDVSWHLPVPKVFNVLIAGFDEDPGLLDSDEATS
jgi:hypothetical protein